jgi:hypothetical protein
MMGIHIGEMIRAEVQRQGFTYREFGELINKNEKTVPNIFDRTTMTIDLLITISMALQKDFLCIYYQEEPMKSLSLRDDEITLLEKEIKKVTEVNERLSKESSLQRETIEALKGQISLMQEKIKGL